VRSGNLLLCKKPLLYKNSPMYNNGCNSWRGRFYDKPISDIFSGRTNAQGVRVSNAHIIGSSNSQGHLRALEVSDFAQSFDSRATKFGSLQTMISEFLERLRKFGEFGAPFAPALCPVFIIPLIYRTFSRCV
jgi:hypothetical protein